MNGSANGPARIATYPGKRAFDVVAAGFVLLLASPVLAVAAAAVRLTMGSPVLFRQRRPGTLERPFLIYKLRTMNDARGTDGELLPDGERLTPLGRFLRRTSLDELPELINVLRGEMSLVGPRPLLERYLPFFTPRERKRFLARPGITGLAQVSGRNLVDWDRRLELDVVDVESMSFRLDLKILARTLVAVFRREGVEEDPDTVETWLDEERAARGVPAGGSPPAHVTDGPGRGDGR